MTDVLDFIDKKGLPHNLGRAVEILCAGEGLDIARYWIDRELKRRSGVVEATPSVEDLEDRLRIKDERFWDKK